MDPQPPEIEKEEEDVDPISKCVKRSTDEATGLLAGCLFVMAKTSDPVASTDLVAVRDGIDLWIFPSSDSAV